MPERHERALVIGDGLTALVTSYVLTRFGHEVEMLASASELGGISRSFSDSLGNRFDYGYHVLDDGRSAFASHFFQEILGGECHRIELQRAIVLRGKLIPANAPASVWPLELSREFPSQEFEDDSGRPAHPDELRRIYGDYLTDLAREEILRSYPTFRWQLEHGASEQQLMDLIHPWFFPRARDIGAPSTEGQGHAARMRNAGKQFVLYPERGGFGRFIEALTESLDPRLWHLHSGLRELQFDFDRPTASLSKVEANGQTFAASCVFWCAPLPLLFAQLGQRKLSAQAQRLVLGSFSFDVPLKCDYHEVLVGDPAHLVNRISFPCSIGRNGQNTVQIEFLFPEGEYERSDEEWRTSWLGSLEALGMVPEGASPASFDLKSLALGGLPTEDLSAYLEERRRAIAHPDSNLVVPLFALGPQNMTRLIPIVCRNVMQAITSPASS